MQNETVIKSITTASGEAELHLTPSEIVMGLSQATHDDAVQKMQQAQAGLGGGWFARMIGGVLKLGERALIWIPVNPLQPLRFASVPPLLTVILFPTPCLGQNGRP